jgi:hypothetical protein
MGCVFSDGSLELALRSRVVEELIPAGFFD